MNMHFKKDYQSYSNIKNNLQLKIFKFLTLWNVLDIVGVYCEAVDS